MVGVFAVARCLLVRLTDSAKSTHKRSMPTENRANPVESTPQYSLGNLIMGLAGEDLSMKRNCDYEHEFSAEMENTVGRCARGRFVPWDLRPNVRAGLDSKSFGSGGYLVQEDVFSDPVDFLYQQSVLARLGATILPDLQGPLAITLQTGGTTPQWVAQNPGANATDSNAAFGRLNLSPRTLVTTTSFSRQLLKQGTPNTEQFVRRDIARAIGAAIDAAGIAGSGSSNQPVGLLNTNGVNNVPIGTNGGAPTYSVLTQLEEAVGNSNVDETAGLGFATNPTMRRKLRNVFRNGTGSDPAWGDNGVLGHSSLVSKIVPATLTKGTSTDCSALILGDFTKLVIGIFDRALDIVVDRYALKKQNVVEVTIFANVDCGLLLPQAFSVTPDARDV